MSRPLLLLDVDGPLNPHEATPAERPAAYQRHALVPDGWTAERPLWVWLNPEHGPLLLRFAAEHDVELVWATTWEHDANTMIAPLIGLPQLPVIEWPYEADDRWKFGPVLAYAGTRALAWLDDDFRRFPAEQEWFQQERAARGALTLLHHVDPATGLVAADLDAVAAWLRAVRATATSADAGPDTSTDTPPATPRAAPTP